MVVSLKGCAMPLQGLLSSLKLKSTKTGEIQEIEVRLNLSPRCCRPRHRTMTPAPAAWLQLGDTKNSDCGMDPGLGVNRMITAV